MILANRDFRLLWLGQLVSQLGTQFNCMALAWLVLATTGSSVAMGGVFLAQTLPNPLLGWVVGALVDRMDRRRLMIACDLARAALVLALPLVYVTGHLPLWMIYGVTFAVSALTIVFYAGEKSVLSRLVPAQDLTQANAWAEMTSQAAGLLGPVAGGVLITVLPSPVHVLYLDVVSFAWSALLLARMDFRDPSRQGDAEERASLVAQGREGLGFLLSHRFLLVVCLTSAAVNFLLGPYTVVFPVLAERVLHAGAMGYGWLMGGMGGGMLVGSLLADRLSRRFTPAALIYGGMGIVGVCFAAMAGVSLMPAVALAALAGACVAPANVVVLTLVARTTPERLQGRVFASLFALVGTTMPAGMVVASVLLDRVGPREVLVGIGLLTVVVALVGRAFLPAPARADREPPVPSAGF